MRMLGVVNLADRGRYEVPQKGEQIQYLTDEINYVRRDGTYVNAKTKPAGVVITMQVRCHGGSSRQAAEDGKNAILAELAAAINWNAPGQAPVFYSFQFDDMSAARSFQILTGMIKAEHFDEASTNTLILDLQLKGNQVA